MVKRGDPVKRGQVIAKAGQTGNVAAPQLHFEIRKGSTPVDPRSSSASGTAELQTSGTSISTAATSRR